MSALDWHGDFTNKTGTRPGAQHTQLYLLLYLPVGISISGLRSGLPRSHASIVSANPDDPVCSCHTERPLTVLALREAIRPPLEPCAAVTAAATRRGIDPEAQQQSTQAQVRASTAATAATAAEVAPVGASMPAISGMIGYGGIGMTLDGS